MFNKNIMFILVVVLFLISVFIFKGEYLGDVNVKSESYKNINFDSQAQDNNLSAVKEFHERNFDEFKEKKYLKEVEISFKCEIYSIAEWDNIFQTAPLNYGMRMELSKAGMGILIGTEDEYKGFTVLNKVKLDNLYDIKIKIDKKNRLTVIVDGNEELNIADKSFDYSISEITIGTGYSKTRPFHGLIKDFTIDYKILKTSFIILNVVVSGVLLLILIVLGLFIVIIR